jgi:OFA family oxalate/formate antiporter-like MFS transporter
MALLSGATAAAGLTLSATGSYFALLIGFGVIFGASNGVGYALSIRSAGLVPDRAGVGIGVVTAAYCSGAMAFSHFLSYFATPGSYATGLIGLALLMAIAGGVASLLLSTARLPDIGRSHRAPEFLPGEMRLVARVWIVYFLGLVGGLMALGHAAAIVAATGGSKAAIAAGAVIVSAGSLAGSLVAGYLSDRICPHRVLLMSLGCVMAAMLILWLSSGPLLALAGLGVAGLAYGGLITAIPVLARAIFAASNAFRAFAYIFLAWGVAGFLGPWIAGILFDVTAHYAAAFLLGLALAGGAMLLVRDLSRLPR